MHMCLIRVPKYTFLVMDDANSKTSPPFMHNKYSVSYPVVSGIRMLSPALPITVRS